jgi:hypothetical protein
MTKYVKIEKCSRSKSWYEELVGKWYPVYEDLGLEWETFEIAGYKNYILKEDVSDVIDVQAPKEQ